MEEDINNIIIALRKVITITDNVLQDCPDKHEGKLLNKALRDMNTAMEFVVSAKHFKSDQLDGRAKR